MSVRIITTLQPSDKTKLLALHAGFPLEDAAFFVLYEDNKMLCSAAAFVPESDLCYECYAYTAPNYRRQGYFSEILDAAIEELPEDTEFMFYTDGADTDCMSTLKALEAELISEEHMMEFNLKCLEKTGNTAFSADCIQTPLVCKESVIDNTKTLHYENTYGSVQISVFTSYYYLYGFEIQEDFRGKGHGKRFLFQVMHDLAARAPLPLRLQVSGDNLPAFSLYKKTGFQITETLFGYLY